MERRKIEGWMIKLVTIFMILTIGLGLATGPAKTSAAETAEQFYRGKTLTWVTAGGAGSSQDLLGRLLAPFLAQEIGAEVKVENMGSNKGPNYVYKQAKPNGLTLLVRDTNALIMNAVLKAPGLQYDLEKFNYIADVLPQKMLFGVSPKLPYRTLDELCKAKGLKAGGTSARGGLVVTSAVMLEVLGLDGKVITGYKGRKRLSIALAQGEVDIISGTTATAAYLDEKAGDAVYLFVIGNERSPIFPNLPAFEEIWQKIPKVAANPYELISLGSGRAILTTPGVPEERVAYLRKIFDRLNKSKEVQAKIMNFAQARPEFIPGEKLQARITNIAKKKTLTDELQSILNKYLVTK